MFGYYLCSQQNLTFVKSILVPAVAHKTYLTDFLHRLVQHLLTQDLLVSYAPVPPRAQAFPRCRNTRSSQFRASRIYFARHLE